MAAREAQASLRMSAELKKEIEKIANETHRTLSNAIELLLWRGVNEFRKDGILVTLPETKGAQTSTSGLDHKSEQMARELVEAVIEMARNKVRGRKSGGGGGSPPRKRRDAA